MACFNLSRVTAINSTLMNAFVHGVCVRGDAKVSLSNCLIQAAGTRAAFVYQRGSLSLIECQITKTGNEKTPAIQAESIAPDDDAKLSLLRCSVYDNEGPSLVVNGEVELVQEENDLHNGYGIHRPGKKVRGKTLGALSVNACIMTTKYNPDNIPIVVDYQFSSRL